jgi:hypothetical protein
MILVSTLHKEQERWNRAATFTSTSAVSHGIVAIQQDREALDPPPVTGWSRPGRWKRAVWGMG